MQELGLKLGGAPTTTNSAAAYGSVMHHAITVFERAYYTGTPKREALQQAIESFLFFWLPANIEAICDPVPADGWLPRQSYNELRNKGVDVLKKYADLINFDDQELLATEFSFIVPIQGTWDYELEKPHELAGSIDRLATRYYRRALSLCVDDYKTGVPYTYLRQNLQGTAYCYATTQREFWIGNGGEDGFGEERGEELFQRFGNAGRRFTWINLRTVKYEDGGWRGEHDYARFALAVEQYAALIQAEVFPLSISGAVCRFCDMRRVCGGTGIPDDDHGKPAALR
jgi:hypothetical protein